MTRWRGIVTAVVVVGLGLAGAVYVIGRSEALPSGPVEVVWNHTQCAECRMSVSERPYAAQLQTKDGQVLNFDDAGCLFRYEVHNPAAVHAVYYHHVGEDRWLAEAETGFVASGPSPMGYDLGAVPAGTAGALSPARARAQVMQPAGTSEGSQADAH